ncbi:glutamine amidotransferase of anthranilate synthase [Alkaliphilus metalliredigens QYMF]|uniref:Glutamine amidotransferase of anthranilate synthase n=1 Tax=Alkaliphilus metalliredigens (strain QYMF) TaxID=293826 RepID=A6TM72_ALKMQ|nr:aminodeoxychorismate/anthranilate synthase component II [Alkaliphilus metalliredigens]ABR47290.1 glutamine amidotransferase of anthranilate synthase [Alkaliphilus metalliredigens QYMF]
MIVIIDNYDSFTYNLYQYIGEINPEVMVFRNDKVSLVELKEMDISHIIISPGPGFPTDTGISKVVIKELGIKIPILGVCLGHQAIGEAFGGKVVHAKRAIHGKISLIQHNQDDVFEGIEKPLKATRYHSLVVEVDSFPEELEITATSDDGEIMGLKHKKHPIFGLQFHPESIATEGGKKMIRNFLNI